MPSDTTPRVGDVWGDPKDTMTWRRIDDVLKKREFVVYDTFDGIDDPFCRLQDWLDWTSQPNIQRISQ